MRYWQKVLGWLWDCKCIVSLNIRPNEVARLAAVVSQFTPRSFLDDVLFERTRRSFHLLAELFYNASYDGEALFQWTLCMHAKKTRCNISLVALFTMLCCNFFLLPKICSCIYSRHWNSIHRELDVKNNLKSKVTCPPTMVQLQKYGELDTAFESKVWFKNIP